MRFIGTLALIQIVETNTAGSSLTSQTITFEIYSNLFDRFCRDFYPVFFIHIMFWIGTKQTIQHLIIQLRNFDFLNARAAFRSLKIMKISFENIVSSVWAVIYCFSTFPRVRVVISCLSIIIWQTLQELLSVDPWYIYTVQSDLY